MARAGASPVTAAVRSEAGREKVARGTQADGTPLQNFETLMAELAIVTRNLTRIPALPDIPPFWVTTAPDAVQRQAPDRAHASLDERRQKKRPA